MTFINYIIYSKEFSDNLFKYLVYKLIDLKLNIDI